MEKIFTLFTLITALALCPGMYSLLQDSPKKKKARPMWRFALVGSVIALLLHLLS